MDSPRTIGPELVRLRRTAGLSQRALGDRIGVRQQQVARWEASEYRTASLERVADIADALSYAATESEAPLLAAEASGDYGTATAVRPVRDLGEVVARIRAHGDELRDTYRWDRIDVFGSFALGEQTPSSDVDLLVETADPGGFRFIRAADFVEDLLGRRVDVVRPHLLRERLRDRVLGEAVNVWSAR